MNAKHAQENAGVNRQETCELLRKNSRVAADAVRAFTDEQLDTAAPFSLNGQSQPKPSSARENFSGSIGGPLRIPKLITNDRWQVLALHKASTMSWGKYNYQGKDTTWVNVGTTMERVVADLQAKNADLWAKLGAAMV